jgi:hypothetical protein
MLVENFSPRRSRLLLLLLLEVFICLAILTQLFVDVLRIGPMLHLVLLNECVDKIIEVVVEPSNLILHVFLESDTSHLYFVNETSEHSRPVILLIPIDKLAHIYI